MASTTNPAAGGVGGADGLFETSGSVVREPGSDDTKSAAGKDLHSTGGGDLAAGSLQLSVASVRDGDDDADDDDWAADAANPHNWSARRKWAQIASISSIAFSASVGTSILAPSRPQLMAEFSASGTLAILPVSLYVLALGLGPIVGGPASETLGRQPVYAVLTPLGGLFAVGAALSPSLAALCVLRFLAGFCLAPSLAVASGTISDVFRPAERGLPSVVFILMPFLGSGCGPIFGALATSRGGWRWTQWSLAIFVGFAVLAALALGRETFHPVVRRRWAKKRRVQGQGSAEGASAAEAAGEKSGAPPGASLHAFVTVALVRPLHMLVTEPVVALVCLYVACAFATLFTFFAAVPYVFGTVYRFDVEQSGLVFVAVVVGCLLGSVTIVLCEVLLYRRHLPRFPPHMVPPEYRLYPAMIGSVGLPVGMFWFAWSARPDVSWASPALAIVPFAWGNLCLFISLTQYLVDSYKGDVVASAMSANSLARYALAAAFPLFTVQMYSNLGIGWAASLLGFVAVALVPVPFVFFRYGKGIRARSRYETSQA